MDQYADEINLIDLWRIVWRGKLIIFAVTLAFSVAAVFYALSLPNLYQSSKVLVMTSGKSEGGLSALASEYGGLASLAGINLGGGSSNRLDQAKELAKSWPFVDKFVRKYQLKPLLLGVEGWNKETGKIIYDDDVYDKKNMLWVRDVDEEEDPEPTSWDAYEEFMDLLSVSLDEDTGMFRLAIKYYSPQIANQWVELYARELNLHFQEKDRHEAEKNVEYLKRQIKETNVADFRSVLYGMIESQLKTLMLAEVSDEYLLQTIVPSMVAIEKVEPRRSVICIIGFIFGVFFSFAFVLVKHYVSQENMDK